MQKFLTELVAETGAKAEKGNLSGKEIGHCHLSTRDENQNGRLVVLWYALDHLSPIGLMDLDLLGGANLLPLVHEAEARGLARCIDREIANNRPFLAVTQEALDFTVQIAGNHFCQRVAHRNAQSYKNECYPNHVRSREDAHANF
ncbi:hypothetical protein [Aestuariivirga sp.]|uniref:hypothetical protein n=1 Tax=Aestuariivirga sp. TaxID=2650926 RepID=UPI00391CDC8B